MMKFTNLKNGLLAIAVASTSLSMLAGDFVWGNADGVYFPKPAYQTNPVEYLESSINIYYQYDPMFTNDNRITGATITKDGESVCTDVYCNVNEWGWVAVHFTPSPINEPGEYVLTIPANSLKDADDNVIANPEFIHTFVVAASEGPFFTTEPPYDTEVKAPISKIVATCKGGEMVDIAEDGPYPYVEGGPLGTYIEANLAYDEENMENFLILLEPSITEPGTYTITIPEGALLKSFTDIAMPEVKITYNVVAGGEGELKLIEPAYEANPSESAIQENLYEIQVIYTEVEDFALSTDESLLKVTGTRDGESIGEFDLDDQGAMWGRGTGTVAFYVADMGEVLDTPGEYEFKIADGAVLSGGYGFKGVTLNYTVVGSSSSDVDYTVTPDPAESQETVTGPIVITFPDFTSVIGDNEGEETSDIEGTWTGNQFPFVMGECKDNTVTFTLDTPATVEGTYVLTVDTKMIGTKADNEKVVINPFSITYNVTGMTGGGDYTISIDPAEGDVLALQEFTLTFDGATYVVVKDNYAPSDLPVLYRVSDEAKTKASASYLPLATGNKFNFSLQQEVATPGEYVLEIPAQLLTVDGAELSEDLSFKYTIVASSIEIPYTCTFAPESGSELEELTVITTTFASEQEGVTFKRMSVGAAYPKMFVVAEDESEEQITGSITGESEGESISFTWAPYYDAPEAGALKYVIPAEYIKITDAEGNVNYNEEIIATYVLKQSGVSILFGDKSNVEVYTIDGTCVGRNLNQDAVKQLPAGLYIINGKKVILR